MLTGSGQNGKRIRSGGRAYPDEDVKPPVERHHLNLKMSLMRNVVSPYFRLARGRQVARQTDGNAGKGCWKKRRPICNGSDKGSKFALTRKSADFRRVSNDEKSG